MNQEFKGLGQHYLQLYEAYKGPKKNLVALELRLTKLAAKLEVSQKELVCLSPQLVPTHAIRNRAWGMGYKLGL